MAHRSVGRDAGRLQNTGLVVGVLLSIATYLALGGATIDEPARRLAGVTVLMASWWITEAVPLPVTAMLPLVLFHPLGIQPVSKAAQGFSNPLVFLFMGGLFLGQGLERWGAHRRLALRVILISGTSPRRIVAGVMIAAAVASALVSNTATTMMMLPIVASIAELAAGNDPVRPGVKQFGVALMLGLAFASSIGGMATLTGTPPNGILAAYMRDELGTNLSWGGWLLFGVPVAAVLLPAAWALLVVVHPGVRLDSIPGGRNHIKEMHSALGRPSRGEILAATVFALTAAAWILHGPITELLNADRPEGDKLVGLHDGVIAMGGALLLFALPAGGGKRVLDWRTAVQVPWGVLLLFGGGLSLASAFGTTGLDRWLGELMTGAAGMHPLLIILGVTAGIVGLTTLTSNTATTSTMLPVLGSAAVGLGVGAQPLVVAAAVGASCAYMLPVATPPNAIVFSTGRLRIADMALAGFWMSLVSIVVIALFVWLLGGRLLGWD